MRNQFPAAVMVVMLCCCSLSAQKRTGELPFVVEKNVMVPMRDGTKLAANIFRPKQEGRYPVILQRTPYGKMPESSGEAARACEGGYVVVAQDCRGRGSSEGIWEPFRYDSDDGFDTQEWIGQQPWCDGRIGTSGGSYVGWTQWAAAVRGSKFLKCMVPVVPFTDSYHEIAYVGGAFQLSLALGWGSGVGGLKIPPDRMKDRFSYLPLSKWDEQGDKRVFFLRDWVEHSTYDDYWRARGIDGHFEQVNVPVLNIGGWYDIFSKATLDHVANVRKLSTNQVARQNQHVLIGPWGHGVGGQKLGQIDFGPEAKANVGALQFQWFEHWLKGKQTGVENWPAVRIFVMGQNAWRNESEWPLARTKWTPWYLHSAEKARTLNAAQPETEPSDKFTYDPANPVPTKGGNNLTGPPIGPFDQTEVETRADVLTYTSAPLEKDVEVTGPVKLILFAASTARDTDFTGKLIDVYPDGKAYNLCDGIMRARYRESFTNPTLIEPGKAYRYEVDLWVTSNLFKKGHRIRLEVSSSNFPRFDRNPNTGHKFGADAELATAVQTILHDKEHPSHLLLPIIP